MASPNTVDDSYATEKDTPLIVGRDASFQFAGSAASVGVLGFEPTQSFVQTGTAAIVSAQGFASSLTHGLVFFGNQAFVSPQGNAGSANANPALEADYAARTAQPGVVWHHNFAADAEVDQFRWQGGVANDSYPWPGSNDGNTRRVTSDGVTGGGCLQLTIPDGDTTSSSWARPFSPLTGATNGRGSDDPGADSAITAQAWNVGLVGSPGNYDDYLGKWTHGTYSNKDYYDDARNSGNGYVCDGDEFWLQFRVKIEGTRVTTGNPAGKLLFTTICGNGVSHITPNQELVVQCAGGGDVQEDGHLSAYTNFGNRSNSTLYADQSDNTTNRKPGGEFPNCTYAGGDYKPDFINTENCGGFTFDGWHTVLIHIKAGHDGGNGDSPIIAGNSSNDTTFELWLAGPGETEYTRHYSRNDWVWSFGENDSTPLGWSCFQPSGYMNGVNSVAGWYHRYDEMVFSKHPIVCPQVTPTALEERTRALSDGEFFHSNDGHATAEIPNCLFTQDPLSVSWQAQSGWYDPIRRRVHYTGKDHGELYEHNYLDEVSNTWVNVPTAGDMGTGGHFRGHCFDPATGRLFYQRESSDNVWWYNPDTNAWTVHSTHTNLAGIGGERTTQWVTGFHPNLFGQGKPGLLHFNYDYVRAFEFTEYLTDPTAGTWTELNVPSWPSSSLMDNFAAGGTCTYLSDRDEVMVTGRGINVAGAEVLSVAAGAGALAPNVDIGNGIEVRTNAQKAVANNSGTDKMFICIHPRKPGRILLMNAGSTTTQYSDDGGQTWSAGPAHPFATELNALGNMSVTSLPYHGVVMGMTNNGTNNVRFCFWRPEV